MNDFKSFEGNGKNGGGNEARSADGGADLNRTVNAAAMLAKAFSGKSERDVWQTILAQAEQGKKDGTLTNADLENFYNALAPMLDSFKRQKLKNIINRLKSI